MICRPIFPSLLLFLAMVPEPVFQTYILAADYHNKSMALEASIKTGQLGGYSYAKACGVIYAYSDDFSHLFQLLPQKWLPSCRNTRPACVAICTHMPWTRPNSFFKKFFVFHNNPFYKCHNIFSIRYPHEMARWQFIINRIKL